MIEQVTSFKSDIMRAKLIGGYLVCSDEAVSTPDGQSHQASD